MKTPTSDILTHAQALREGGMSHKEIMGQTGLSHSQMERYFMAVDIESGLIKGGFLAQPDSLTAKAAVVAKLRLAGESWGLISVRFREPESRTRKQFAEASGIDSAGLRIGRGGRYLADDPRFYTGSDRAKLGTELIPTVPALKQIPDPDTEQKRTLPTVAAGPKPKRTTKVAVKA